MAGECHVENAIVQEEPGPIVIAALAAAREGAVASETSGPPARSPPRAPDAPAAGPAREAVSLGLDVAGLAVPALGGGGDRFGGFARANLDLSEPLLFSAGAEYAVGTENPSFGWFTAFAEVGSRVPRGPGSVSSRVPTEHSSRLASPSRSARRPPSPFRR